MQAKQEEFPGQLMNHMVVQHTFKSEQSAMAITLAPHSALIQD